MKDARGGIYKWLKLRGGRHPFTTACLIGKQKPSSVHGSHLPVFSPSACSAQAIFMWVTPTTVAMASYAVAWTILLLAGLSTATPAVYFPINSQIPPVARVGEPFSFVFSPSTFSSSSATTYTLANRPAWLSLDSDARRLFGTPTEEDVLPGRVVGVPVHLVATDDSGSTTLSAVLVVSRRPGPKVEIPFERQPPDFGVYSSPCSLLSGPENAFSFALDPSTFSNPSDAPVRYYATMADNTPLPAWIAFDPAKLAFSGRTPPSGSLIQPPERFSLRVIASDIAGFAGASLGFDIVVSNHQLVADNTTIILSAVPGTPILYTTLRGTVKVDGEPATPEAVWIASTPDIPPWLSVDKDTWHITGTPLEDARSTTFTITLRDRFSDTLNLTIALEVASETARQAVIFNGALPEFTIIAGRPFSFDLRLYLVDPQDTQISIVVESSYPWIQFDTNTHRLFGDAPKGLKDATVDIQVNAVSKDSKGPVSSTLKLHIQGASGETPVEQPRETPGGHTFLAGHGLENASFNPVLLAALLPALLLVAAILCLFFWSFRRRQGRQNPRLTVRDISWPLPNTLVTEATTSSSDPDASCALPDPSKRFGKNFSADDVFVSERRSYVESRNAFLARPSRPQSQAPQVWLVSPDSSLRSHPPDKPRTGSRRGVDSSGVGRARSRPQDKVNSSLSSITERSNNDELDGSPDERTLDSHGSDSKMSASDKLDVSIPRIPQAPGSGSTATAPRPCDADGVSTPQGCSPLASLDTDTMALEAQSRFSHDPAASAAGRFAWPWLRRTSLTRSDSRLGRILNKRRKQPGVATDGTIASPVSGQLENASPRTTPDMWPLPLFRRPSRILSSRLTPKGKKASRDTRDHDHGAIKPEGDGTTLLAKPGSSVDMRRDGFGIGLPDWQDTPDGLLGMPYPEPQVEPSPLRTSGTWSTILSEDEQMDEVVGSPQALSLQQQSPGTGQSTPQANWTLLPESPVLRGWDEPGSPAFAASPSPMPSRPRMAKERSKGSKDGPDYEVYI